jgi:lambda family phage portal protein
MRLFKTIQRKLFGGTPTYDGVGGGRRSLAWAVGNPGAVAALLFSQSELRAKSRDLVRRNAWASAALEAYVSNAVGTGIKPQAMIVDPVLREQIQSLWRDWTEVADASGLTDFYGQQALACRAMLEGGEALIRIRFRRPEDGLPVAMQLQVLEPEHLPLTMNTTADNGNVIRAGIEFDALGRRVAYHLYRNHPEDGFLAPMSSSTGLSTVRVDAAEIIHLFRPLRPGQIRGEPWLARALVKLHELDQYDDAELVRKKTAAMFAGFITRLSPEDNLVGEGVTDANGVALAGLEPGTLQILEPGEDIKFSQPADVGASYSDFLRMQFRAVAAAMGVSYEQLTGDLTQVPPGSPGTVGTRGKRKVRSFVIPHITHDDVVLPEEVQGIRTFGSETEMESIANVMAGHLDTMRNKHSITLEHLRMGALKGVILDADGTVI